MNDDLQSEPETELTQLRLKSLSRIFSCSQCGNKISAAVAKSRLETKVAESPDGRRKVNTCQSSHDFLARICAWGPLKGEPEIARHKNKIINRKKRKENRHKKCEKKT